MPQHRRSIHTCSALKLWMLSSFHDIGQRHQLPQYHGQYDQQYSRSYPAPLTLGMLRSFQPLSCDSSCAPLRWLHAMLW